MRNRWLRRLVALRMCKIVRISLPAFVLTVFLGTLLVRSAIGQTEPSNYRAISSAIVTAFNDEKYLAIGELCNEDLKEEHSNARIRKIFRDLRSSYGTIVTCAFERLTGGGAEYKLSFASDEVLLRISLNRESRIDALTVYPYAHGVRTKDRTESPLALPFQGAWVIHSGGESYKGQNGRTVTDHAYTISIAPPGATTYRTNGETNEDYYSYGKEILSPADGIVVEAVDGVRENTPKVRNLHNTLGNAVTILTFRGEYIFLSHFKRNSVRVTEGEMVTKGQVIGLCGNSGNSTEPHLYMVVQNAEVLGQGPQIKCYFDSIIVNGTVRRDYSPTRNDVVQNP